MSRGPWGSVAQVLLGIHVQIPLVRGDSVRTRTLSMLLFLILLLSTVLLLLGKMTGTMIRPNPYPCVVRLRYDLFVTCPDKLVHFGTLVSGRGMTWSRR